MKKRLMLAFVFAAAVLFGCGSPEQKAGSDAAKGKSEQEIGKQESRDVLIPKCRAPCNVSPGPGCC